MNEGPQRDSDSFQSLKEPWTYHDSFEVTGKWVVGSTVSLTRTTVEKVGDKVGDGVRNGLCSPNRVSSTLGSRLFLPWWICRRARQKFVSLVLPLWCLKYLTFEIFLCVQTSVLSTELRSPLQTDLHPHPLFLNLTHLCPIRFETPLGMFHPVHPWRGVPSSAFQPGRTCVPSWMVVKPLCVETRVDKVKILTANSIGVRSRVIIYVPTGDFGVIFNSFEPLLSLRQIVSYPICLMLCRHVTWLRRLPQYRDLYLSFV